MGRKVNKYGKNEKCSKSEKESLLSAENAKPTENSAQSNLNVPKETKKPERKKSAWAPVATATTFEDVPIFTICPYCSSKVVTKTHFKKLKKHWLCCCCCLPYFLDVFKDVIHICPKCNTQIAIYNRFHLFSPSKDTMNTAEEGGELKPEAEDK